MLGSSAIISEVEVSMIQASKYSFLDYQNSETNLSHLLRFQFPSTF